MRFQKNSDDIIKRITKSLRPRGLRTHCDSLIQYTTASRVKIWKQESLLSQCVHCCLPGIAGSFGLQAGWEIWLSGLNHWVHTLLLSDVFPSRASITPSNEHMARQVKSCLSLVDCEQWLPLNPQSQHDWAEGICRLMDSVSRSNRKWGACLLARREGPMA